MNDNWYQLARFLQDGEWHSGEDIASRLGITRAAVWNYARALQQRGVAMTGVRGRGYRLERPLDLLSSAAIQENLAPKVLGALRGLTVHAEVDSTNDYLRRHGQPGPARAEVCIAEAQTKGRGRRGKTWHSPLGGGVFLSLLWQFDRGASTLAGLSLAVATAVADAMGVEGVAIKWPNDIVVDGNKVAGILVEVEGDADEGCRAIIGVGVNVLLDSDSPIDQPWTDLHRLASSLPSRNALAASLIDALVRCCLRFEKGGLEPFREAFAKRDWLAGQVVRASGDATLEGVASGIDAMGRLTIETAEGVKRVTSGEVSVRRA